MHRLGLAQIYCVSGPRLLLIRHEGKPPNAEKWNGPGGRIEPGESPRVAATRELLEETGVVVRPEDARFAGVVTWRGDSSQVDGGMYVFVADLGSDAGWSGRRQGTEGTLGWLTRRWFCRRFNPRVPQDIVSFVPAVLAGAEPVEYRCLYEGERLVRVDEYPLDSLYNPDTA